MSLDEQKIRRRAAVIRCHRFSGGHRWEDRQLRLPRMWYDGIQIWCDECVVGCGFLAWHLNRCMWRLDRLKWQYLVILAIPIVRDPDARQFLPLQRHYRHDRYAQAPSERHSRFNQNFISELVDISEIQILPISQIFESSPVVPLHLLPLQKLVSRQSFMALEFVPPLVLFSQHEPEYAYHNCLQ